MKHGQFQALQQQQRRIANKVKAKNPELATQLANAKLDWFRISNSADGDTADIYIYDEIMPQWMTEFFGGGISAEGMITQLNDISASTINVRINSPGGAVFEAIAIYNALVTHSATINVFVDALAASAASVIAMAGDKITMMVGAQMMIHDASGIELGNAAELRAFADFLDRQSDNIASIYAERSGGDPADLRGLMLAETWMFSEEAVELGLADEVYTRTKNADPNPEEDPEEEEEPAPEEDGDDDDESTEDPEEEKPVEDLMGRKHSIAARGFKHAGRKKAPAPPHNSTVDMDKLTAVFANFLGGK